MIDSQRIRTTIPISNRFFCDGFYYVLTSTSLGNSGIKPEEISDSLGYSKDSEIENLLKQGICLPLFFDGDCALDNNTIFVLGQLTEQEENDWIGRLVWKLNIPCGKLVLLCGGGDPDDFAQAISGEPPPENYEFFQVIDVSPGEYLVEIYAYLSSMTVQQFLHQYDENWNRKENEKLHQWYQTHRPGIADTGYIIRLAPLENEPSFPKLVPEIGWCGEFEFRQPEL